MEDKKLFLILRHLEKRASFLEQYEFKVTHSTSTEVGVWVLTKGESRKHIGEITGKDPIIKSGSRMDWMFCVDDLLFLRKKYPQVIRDRKRGIPRILKVDSSYIHSNFREKKIGKELYLHAAREYFKNVGPFLFIPDKCDEGSTSFEATMVWKSLSRNFPSSGYVIVILKEP